MNKKERKNKNKTGKIIIIRERIIKDGRRKNAIKGEDLSITNTCNYSEEKNYTKTHRESKQKIKKEKHES